MNHKRLRGWTGVLLVASLALGGGCIGLIVGAAMMSGHRFSLGGLAELLTGSSPSVDLAAILGGWGFVAAGVMLGGYVGVFLGSIHRTGVACPRCGTTNAAEATACKACDLRFPC